MGTLKKKRKAPCVLRDHSGQWERRARSCMKEKSAVCVGWYKEDRGERERRAWHYCCVHTSTLILRDDRESWRAVDACASGRLGVGGVRVCCWLKTTTARPGLEPRRSSTSERGSEARRATPPAVIRFFGNNFRSALFTWGKQRVCLQTNHTKSPPAGFGGAMRQSRAITKKNMPFCTFFPHVQPKYQKKNDAIFC